MGPSVTTWLNVNTDELSPLPAAEVSETLKQNFSDFLLSHIEKSLEMDEATITDLMDELIAMDLPMPVLKLADKFSSCIKNTNNFQYLLSVGIAAMQVDELDRAEQSFRMAQETMPEEPAPYVNLIQIFLHSDRIDEALEWVDAGLTAEPNNFRIWELISEVVYSLSSKNNKTPFELALEIAKKHNSWAGFSLAADLDENANSQTKAALLDSLYSQGERSSDFLIEYTGALGAAGDFEKIPQIIWQAEKASSTKTPWQLQLHGSQAFLAMNQNEQFISSAQDILSKNNDLPENLRNEINNMIVEIRGEMAETPSH